MKFCRLLGRSDCGGNLREAELIRGMFAICREWDTKLATARADLGSFLKAVCNDVRFQRKPKDTNLVSIGNSLFTFY